MGTGVPGSGWKGPGMLCGCSQGDAEERDVAQRSQLLGFLAAWLAKHYYFYPVHPSP